MPQDEQDQFNTIVPEKKRGGILRSLKHAWWIPPFFMADEKSKRLRRRNLQLYQPHQAVGP
jgi:hypothetical protein